jgi:predicted HTH transcriptional regulator
MREPWEWDESDIQSLINNQIEESINLDYKKSDSLARDSKKITELTKDVSALANSAGGTLVYGVSEDRSTRPLPVEIDGGIDPSEITREWLEQILNSRIQRKIEGIRINPVALSGANVGRVVWVIDVPQSVRTPHQADDKKFYKRYNFQSAPMEEYEVRDLYYRQEAPDVRLVLDLADPVVGQSSRLPLFPSPTGIR